MKAELKLIMDSNGELDLESYSPLNDDFCINILLGIGLSDSEKMDHFEIRVCSLKWLELNEPCSMLLRHTLIIDKYNYKELLEILERFVDKCNGASWNEISFKLSRYFLWEFEDYVEISS